MIQRPVLLVLLVLSFAGCSTQPTLVEIVKPKALPLQIDDRFQIRKIIQFFNEPSYFPPTTSDVISFERNYYNYGAISQLKFDELRGNYTAVYWRTSKRANVTVRYEYYQTVLSNHVQAMERSYPNAYGSYRSTFNLIGDNYLEFGRPVSWRILIIVDKRIVAFCQSFLWK